MKYRTKDEEINALESEIESLEGEIRKLKGENSELYCEIVKLETELGTCDDHDHDEWGEPTPPNRQHDPEA